MPNYESWYIINEEGVLCNHSENDGARAFRKGLQAEDTPIPLSSVIDHKEICEVISRALERGAEVNKFIKSVFGTCCSKCRLEDRRGDCMLLLEPTVTGNNRRPNCPYTEFLGEM